MTEQETWRKGFDWHQGYFVTAKGEVVLNGYEEYVDQVIADHEKAEAYDDFMVWLTDQQVVHWTLSEETEHNPRKAVEALLQNQLDITYDPAVSELAAKARLAERVVGYMRRKSEGKPVPNEDLACRLWLKDWDALTQPGPSTEVNGG